MNQIFAAIFRPLSFDRGFLLERLLFALSHSKYKQVGLFKSINEDDPSVTFRTVIHVLPYQHGMWQIKFEGESESHSVFGSNSTAVEMARGLARKYGPCHLVVHREDAAKEYEHTHSADADPHLGED